MVALDANGDIAAGTSTNGGVETSATTGDVEAAGDDLDLDSELVDVEDCTSRSIHLRQTL